MMISLDLFSLRFCCLSHGTIYLTSCLKSQCAPRNRPERTHFPPWIQVPSLFFPLPSLLLISSCPLDHVCVSFIQLFFSQDNAFLASICPDLDFSFSQASFFISCSCLIHLVPFSSSISLPASVPTCSCGSPTHSMHTSCVCTFSLHPAMFYAFFS